jgi:hypothetical protein
MPHVSKKKLSDKQQFTLDKNFSNWLDTLSKSNTSIAVRSLLTDTERIMLAKRLSIIFLIGDGLSSYKISKMCSVTIQTVQRLQVDLESGRFDDLVKLWDKKKARDEMWKLIETFSRMGLPSYVGKDRYKNLPKRLLKSN